MGSVMPIFIGLMCDYVVTLKKLLDSDLLRAVQLKKIYQCKKCNTSAKSVIPSANYKSKFLNLIFSPQVSEIGIV